MKKTIRLAHMNARRPSTRPTQAGRPRRGTDVRATRPVESRRNETRKRRGRFETRRTLEIPGKRGPRRFSLRFLTILLFALAGLVAVTPTLTKYLEKQEELRSLQSQLVSLEERNKDLERELKLWEDKDYVTTQARERLGYVLPGQTLYVVTDPSAGTAQEQLEAKVASVNHDRRAASSWLTTLWDSVSVAGQTDQSDNPNNAPLIKDKNE